MATNGKDISQMTDQEIKAFLDQRKVDQAKIVREKGVAAKAELEAYCLKKYGISLAAIFTASSEGKGPKTYKNPTDSSLYTYSGRGKVPAWLKIGGTGNDKNKPNPAYEHKSN
jgi:hypothetical protein